MPVVATISQSALAENLASIKAKCGKAKIVSMVKAAAYGHQIEMVAPIIKGSDFLAVSNLAEATKLRRLTTKPILLLLGVANTAELTAAISLKCHITIFDLHQIEIIKNTKTKLNIWLKVDSGMRRLGLLPQQISEALDTISTNPKINIVCLMSHFASADEPKNPTNNSQITRFKKLPAAKKLKLSMANSAAILSREDAAFDFIRPGIMLYGISPFEWMYEYLQPAMQLSAPIISLKTIKKGEQVGYGGTWTASKKSTIAIIGIGYADGYPRHAQNSTPILINKVICPLVGRVSMDLIMADVSKIKVKVGDLAILWGDKELRVEEVAKSSNTIAYELVSRLNSRVIFTAVE